MYYGWKPYVPVAPRRRKAADAMGKWAQKGQPMSPVIIQGRSIATTAWGKAWCANMKSYSDSANRLPRGRSYVRNGSVVDLQVTAGMAEARVSGSSVYRTTITVKPMPKAQWQQICADCAGGIESLVELLQGRFSKGVMDRLCRQGEGLFPVSQDIHFDCSCPDGACMCKHVAAVLYGLGALFGLEMDGPGGAAPAVRKLPRAAGKPKAAPRARTPVARLLAALRRAGWLDNAAARAATGLDADVVRPLLKQLVADGHARVQGQGRSTRYLATGKVPEA